MIQIKFTTQEFLDSLNNNTSIRVKIDDFEKMLLSNEDLLGWPRFYVGKASVSLRADKLDSTIYYVNKAIEVFNTSKIKRDIDKQHLVSAYNLRGSALSLQKDYTNAIIDYQKSLDLSKIHPYKWISFARAGLARLHAEIGMIVFH